MESFVHNFASIHLTFCKDAFYEISATVFATKCNESAKFEEEENNVFLHILQRNHSASQRSKEVSKDKIMLNKLPRVFSKRWVCVPIDW